MKERQRQVALLKKGEIERPRNRRVSSASSGRAPALRRRTASPPDKSPMSCRLLDDNGKSNGRKTSPCRSFSETPRINDLLDDNDNSDGRSTSLCVSFSEPPRIDTHWTSEETVDSGFSPSDVCSDKIENSLSIDDSDLQKDRLDQPSPAKGIGDVTSEEPEVETICSFAFFRATRESSCKNLISSPSRCDFKNSEATSTSSSNSCNPEVHTHPAHTMTLYGHKAAVTQCHVTSTLVITSSSDATLRIWSLETGQQLKALNCQRPVHDFKCIAEETGVLYLIAGCEDGGILIISVNNTKAKLEAALVGEYTGHLPNPIRSLSISPDQKRLATGCCFLMNQINFDGRHELSVRGTLKVWDLGAMLEAARELQSYDCQPLMFKTMRQLVGGSRTSVYHRYNSIEGDHRKDTYHGMRALVYSPNGSVIIVGLGHPFDIGVHDMKLVNIVCAKTLTTLWREERDSYQIRSVTILPSACSSQDSGTFQLIVSTQFTLSRLTIVCTCKYEFM